MKSADPCRRTRQGALQGSGSGAKGRRAPRASGGGGRALAEEMLGQHTRHAADRAAGKRVNRLYIEQGSDIAREFYLSLLVDRRVGRVAFVVSTAGGMNIEEVAATTPEKIVTLSSIRRPASCRITAAAVATALRLEGDLAKRSEGARRRLYDAFLAKDMSLLEINPLIVTEGRPARLPRRQDGLRRQRARPASRHRRRCATRRRRTRRRSRRRSTSSPTSRSTARSAAW